MQEEYNLDEGVTLGNFAVQQFGEGARNFWDGNPLSGVFFPNSRLQRIVILQRLGIAAPENANIPDNFIFTQANNENENYD